METAAVYTTRRDGFADATTASAGSPADSSSVAGCGGRCFSRGGSRSCSSSTRRPRWPAGIVHARCAAGQTTTASGRSGGGSHPGDIGADAIDERLHDERVEPDTHAQRTHEAEFADLPDGSFVLLDGAPCLVLGSELLTWTAAGYTTRRARPSSGRALQITPPSLVEVLRAVWRPVVPLVHPSASES